VITPTSLQKNFISQAKMYGLSDEELDNNYTFYTIQGIANAMSKQWGNQSGEAQTPMWSQATFDLEKTMGPQSV
jgi:hypothetical protein